MAEEEEDEEKERCEEEKVERNEEELHEVEKLVEEDSLEELQEEEEEEEIEEDTEEEGDNNKTGKLQLGTKFASGTNCRPGSAVVLEEETSLEGMQQQRKEAAALVGMTRVCTL